MGLRNVCIRHLEQLAVGTGSWMSRFVTAEMPLQVQVASHRRAQNTCVYSFRMFKGWKLKETLIPLVLLMEEILPQLICGLAYYLQGLYILGGAGFLSSIVAPIKYKYSMSGFCCLSTSSRLGRSQVSTSNITIRQNGTICIINIINILYSKGWGCAALIS